MRRHVYSPPNITSQVVLILSPQDGRYAVLVKFGYYIVLLV